MRLTYPPPSLLHGDRLTAELQAAGVKEASVVLADRLVIYASDDTDPGVVANVVAAHDPAAFLAAEASRSAEVAAQWAQLDVALAKCRAVIAGTDTFTNQQAQQLLARVTLAVARKVNGG